MPSTLFRQPGVLWLLTLLPALLVLAAWSRHRRRKALTLLGSIPALQVLTPLGRMVRILRGGCVALGLAALIAGAAGPQWGRAWEQALRPGRDVVVVLDLSRSMLAEQPRSEERRVGKERAYGGALGV